MKPRALDDAIAITGLAARLPGAPDVETFWKNLLGGHEAVTFFDRDELLRAGVPAAQLDDARYVRARGTLDGIDLFDAQFFGVTPREAELMDPQHRLFLECAWHALEDAGCDPSRFDGMIGVFASAGLNTYLLNNVSRNPEILEAAGSFQAFVGNDKDFLPMRVSYKLGLRGPSIGVQTACSSSLVATALACQALLTHQCDAALVGAANVVVPQLSGYVHHEGGSFSPDGHCRPFDAGAAGTVFSNGAGAVMLKRLADAIADGDTIRAVITGFAVNNDGAAKIGFTAPSVEGQAEAVTLALELAGRHPDEIGYIETHGTGTILGDPIEIAALTQVFRAYTARRGFCAIGSVKSNIGHLDVAAGLAGLIKTTLAVERGVIPPSINFERPNARIDFPSTPFFVNTEVRPWNDEPRRAGLTSLGLGGTNAHLVLEQAPPQPTDATRRTRHILPLSARAEGPLASARTALAAAIRGGNLADAAFTLQHGRKAFELRQYVLAGDAAEAAEALERRGGAPVRAAAPRVALLFPGQGSQYAGLGRELAKEEPLFREAFDDVANRFRDVLGWDLRDALDDGARLDDTAVTQPVLFAYEYAFARALAGYGITPAAMAGHSLGEYVAATLAGVFTLDAAVRVVAARGRLMARCAPGRMLAVAAEEVAVRAILPGELALAAVNAPSQCVVSGPAEAIVQFEALLRERGIDVRPLPTSHAFHSPMMDGAAEALETVIRDARPAAPAIPFISNVTGTWITPEQATSARYWSEQLRSTVRFADGLVTLAADRALVLIDAGPRQTAARLARQAIGRTARVPLPPLRQWAADAERDRDYFLESLGALWCEGVEVDWSAMYRGETRRRVPLPGYAFEHKRFWVDPSQPVAATAAREVSESRIDRNFFEIAWNESAPPARGESPRTVVVLEDESSAGRAIAERLAQAGLEVIRERAASADYERLLDSLQPGGVAFVHCGALDAPASFEAAQDAGYHSVIALAKTIARKWSGHESSLRVLTRGAWDVVAGDRVNAAAATVFGPVKVLSQEYPNVGAQVIDVGDGADAHEIAGAAAAELAAPPAVSLVAWRDGRRYERTPQRASVPRERSRIRHGGHYFITGGLGQFGLILAEHLMLRHGARVTLLSRRQLPPKSEWPAIRRQEARNATAAAIHRLARLTETGDDVFVATGDVADRAALEAAVAAAEARFGPIHGVIHAAGVTGVEHFRTIPDTGRADAALHFAAKAHGLIALESVFAPRTPDFVMAVSSLSPILGGLGFSAYAAANIFMDAFVRARRKAGGGAYMTVNWEGWLPQHEEGHLLFGKQQLERMMSDDEIADVFERTVAAQRVQLVSATDDLVAREREWSTLGRTPAATSETGDDSTTEAGVLRVWREVLGVEDLDAETNFYAAGGSSLSAMQIIARLRARLHIDLPLESFLTAQTPRALAALIDGKRPPETAASLAPAAVEDILAEIEALGPEPPPQAPPVAAAHDDDEPLDLSIIFFSGDAMPATGGKYDLLLASAQRADALGFSAVWLPERHFQKFGGLYPNPSVLAAMVAAKTARIGIRAGSVVLPLHDPIRVAEEWSVVDNLSGGRVALSFAAGWHPNDFVFAPAVYADRRRAMFRDIDVVRKLWRGESVERALPDGSRAGVAILPRPLQPELPVWVTAESTETFVAAGEIGANILTGLINQTKEELAGRIALWRRTLAEHGHDPAARHVTLMLHTYVARDARLVDERVRPSLTRYLGDFLSQNTKMMAALAGVDPQSLTEADRATLVRFAVDRYIAGSSLIGTPDHCLRVLDELRRAGVGEVATLIDFGIAAEDALSSLELLAEFAGKEKRAALSRS